jgi:hypothetical protein
MGDGCRRAIVAAGSERVWFDAVVNFLVNYQPFHFKARAHIIVGVDFELNIGTIIHEQAPERRGQRRTKAVGFAAG